MYYFIVGMLTLAALQLPVLWPSQERTEDTIKYLASLKGRIIDEAEPVLSYIHFVIEGELPEKTHGREISNIGGFIADNVPWCDPETHTDYVLSLVKYGESPVNCNGEKGFAVICLLLTYIVVVTLPWWHKWIFYAERFDYGLRNAFRTTVRVGAPLPDNHTHPKSAQGRNEGLNTARHFAEMRNMSLYVRQYRAADANAGLQGDCVPHWAKDLKAPPTSFWQGCWQWLWAPWAGRKFSTIVYYGDCADYYDMQEQLRLVCPCLVYNVAPSVAAASRGEYRYRFKPDNRLIYEVNGGERYEAECWDFAVSSFTVSDGWLGYIAYDVERLQMDEDHQLILLTPYARWSKWQLPNWCGGLGVCPAGEKLRRLQPAAKGAVVLERIVDGVANVSIAIDGAFSSVVMTRAQFDTLTAQKRSMSSAFSLHTVKSVLDVKNYDLAQVVCYFNENEEQNVERVEQALAAPQTFPAHSCDGADEKPCMRPFHPPMIPEAAFVPTVGIIAQEAAVKGRIKDIQHTKELKVSSHMSRVIKETARLVAGPFAGTLFPLEVAEVAKRQARASQLHLVKKGEESLPIDATLEVFVKKEAYLEPKDPRVITTFAKDPATKLEWSAVIYAMEEVLHAEHNEWYAFGVSPKCVALRMAGIAENAQFLITTDFSRFDGRVSNILRMFEECLLRDLFHYTVVEEVVALWKRTYNRKSRMPGDAHHRLSSFLTLWTRLSGGTDTSCFNSVDGKFIATLAYTMTQVEGKYMSVEDAFEKKTLQGGDDGVAPDLDPEIFDRAAALCGAKAKCARYERGSFGVNFLGRKYSPDVFFGSPDSMQDFMRTATKWHLCSDTAGVHADWLHAVNKAMSGLMDDPNTPLLSDWNACVLAQYGAQGKFKFIPEDWSYRSLQQGDHYPNENSGGWMYAEIERECPKLNCALFDRFAQLRKLYESGQPLDRLPSFYAPSMFLDRVVGPNDPDE